MMAFVVWPIAISAAFQFLLLMLAYWPFGTRDDWGLLVLSW